MPLDNVAICGAGKRRSGNVVVFGTPALRSTLLATVENFGSAAGIGAGAVAGAATTRSGNEDAGLSPGLTVSVCEPTPSHLRPASRTCAGVARSSSASSSA